MNTKAVELHRCYCGDVFFGRGLFCCKKCSRDVKRMLAEEVREEILEDFPWLTANR